MPPLSCAAQTLGLEGDDRIIERQDDLGLDVLVLFGHQLDRGAQAVKPMEWRAKRIGPSVTLTSTTPSPPAWRAECCIRSMADSRAAYMAWV